MSLEEQSLRQAHLRVNTELTAIKQVLHWFEQFNGKLSAQDSMEARIALTEGFTNAVRHAHCNHPQETPIDISVTLAANQLEICIWDQGAAFDLAALLNRVEQQYPNPLEHEAHWGGTILKKLIDHYGWSIHYCCPEHPGSDRNCLRLKKQFD